MISSFNYLLVCGANDKLHSLKSNPYWNAPRALRQAYTMVRRPVGYSKWTCRQIVDWFCIRVCLILWKGCQVRLFGVLKLFSYSTIWLFILIASVIQLFAYFVMSYEAIWLFTYSAILQLTCEVVPPLLQNGFKMLETWMEQIGLKHCQKYPKWTPKGARMYPKTSKMSPNASNI